MTTVPRIAVFRRLMPVSAAVSLAFTAAPGPLAAQEEPPPPRAIPVPEEAEETSVEEAATPPVAPDPAPEQKPKSGSGERTAPRRARTPEEELFDYCEMLFRQKNYVAARRQYDQYVQIHPEGKYRQEARFKLGVCYVRTGMFDRALMEFDSWLRDYPGAKNRVIVLFYAGECHLDIATRLFGEDRIQRMKLAEDAYRAALQASRSGPYAANAAYRLATLAYNEGRSTGNAANYREAIRYFTLAAGQASKEQVKMRHRALYYKGLSQRAVRAPKDATATFEELVKEREGNEFYEKGMLELASLDVEAGRREAAMRRFEELAQEGKQVITRVRSLVNSGLLLAEKGETTEAIAKFEQALGEKGPETRTVSRDELEAEQSRARFGLIFAYNKQNEPNRVLEAWRGMRDYSGMDDDSRAKMLLIVGAAYSAQEQYLRAADIFRLLEESLPKREEALEAGYKRLVCMFKSRDPQLPQAVETYVNNWRGRKAESAFLDKAWRVRAAYYFNRRSWREAANAYQRVREKKLEPEALADYLYERGFAEAECGDKEGIATLTSFLEKAGPGDDRARMAVLQRGLLKMKADDLNGALADFETIRKEHAGSESEESAIFNAARVKGLKQDNEGMVADFKELLEKYPHTRAAAEARYWIGTGYFRLQKFQEALEPLREARKLNPETYYADSTLQIIESLVQLKDVDALIPEVDTYLKGDRPQKIRRQVLLWLAFTLFQDRKDYRAASRYFRALATPDTPSNTEPEVWVALGECDVENKHYEEALQALKAYLDVEQRPSPRARAFWLRGRAFMGLKRYDEATTAAQEGLTLERETVLNAQLLMLAGDAALAAGRRNEALSLYNTVKAGWELPNLTPLAIWKMAGILESGGDAQKAADLRDTLAKRYPDFQPPEESRDKS